MCHLSVKIMVFAAGLIVLVPECPAAWANFSLTPGCGAGAPGGPAGYRTRWTKQSFPVVQGFGRDIPLAFALRQIVPPDVIVIAPSSVRTQYIMVSWRGGAPWNAVLQAALHPAGLAATITPVSVIIKIADP